jgi:ATP-dependent RNA helicase DDX49/DBP8
MTVLSTAANTICDSFSQMNVFCRKVTQASRVCRSIEMIVQARWIVRHPRQTCTRHKLTLHANQELFEAQIQHRNQTTPELSSTKHRKAVFMEACQDFGWSEYVSSHILR